MTRRPDLAALAGQTGVLAVALVDYAGFEPVQRLVAGGASSMARRSIRRWRRGIARLPAATARTARVPGIDPRWLDDAVDEAVFVDQREVEAREQKHFERAIGQLERFVDDKVLVCRRERAALAEKLRSARARRDAVVGATARERIEAEIASARGEGRSARTPIGALDSREDEVYRKMAKRVSRAPLPGADRDPAVSGGVPDQPRGAGDVVLRLLHTADWHLGRRFPSFPDEAQKKLSRARMDVVSTILDVARRNAVHAVLCAGDLFDDPTPAPDFWEGLARIFRDQPGPHPPVFLVPGNHDPLITDSVWAPGHPFRARLPAWVHVVDRDDFTFELAPDAILYAQPVPVEGRRARSGDGAAGARTRRYAAAHRLRPWLHVRHRRLSDQLSDWPRRRRPARPRLPGDW